jgi:hypothetical protein
MAYLPLIFYFFIYPQKFEVTTTVGDTVFVYTNKWHKCGWIKCPFNSDVSIYHSKYDRWGDSDYQFYNYYVGKLHFDHPEWTRKQIDEEVAKYKFCKI